MNAVALRALCALITLLLVTFALVTQRTLQSGEREMQASDRAFDAGELDAAIRHARRAGASYVPGAAHVTAAYDRLEAIARGAERARDLTLAASAWRASRAAALESRHLWQPHGARWVEASANLQRLAREGDGVQAGRSPYDAPQRIEGPRPLGILALALGMGCTVLGFGTSVWLGKRGSGSWVLGRMRWSLALFAAGVVAAGASMLVI